MVSGMDRTGQDSVIRARDCAMPVLFWQIQDLDMSTIHKTQAQVQVVVERGFSARDGGIIFKLNEQHFFFLTV